MQEKILQELYLEKPDLYHFLMFSLSTEGAMELINWAQSKVIPIEPPVKPANGGQIYLLYKRLLGYSDMTPVLVAVFDDVEKALDQKYKLQKDDHVNSYFIEDSRLSV